MASDTKKITPDPFGGWGFGFTIPLWFDPPPPILPDPVEPVFAALPVLVPAFDPLPLPAPAPPLVPITPSLPAPANDPIFEPVRTPAAPAPRPSAPAPLPPPANDPVFDLPTVREPSISPYGKIAGRAVGAFRQLGQFLSGPVGTMIGGLLYIKPQQPGLGELYPRSAGFLVPFRPTVGKVKVPNASRPAVRPSARSDRNPGSATALPTLPEVLVQGFRPAAQPRPGGNPAPVGAPSPSLEPYGFNDPGRSPARAPRPVAGTGRRFKAVGEPKPTELDPFGIFSPRLQPRNLPRGVPTNVPTLRPRPRIAPNPLGTPYASPVELPFSQPLGFPLPVPRPNYPPSDFPVSKPKGGQKPDPLTPLNPGVLTLPQLGPVPKEDLDRCVDRCKKRTGKRKEKPPPRSTCYRGTYQQLGRGIVYHRTGVVPCR